MKKTIVSVLTVFLMLFVLMTGAQAESLVTFGSVAAGSAFSQSINEYIPAGTQQVAAAAGYSLPSGIEPICEDDVWFLKGTPMVAGTYSFKLDAAGDSITFSLTVIPATPSVSASSSFNCYTGDNAQISVQAFVADGGALSYQWFSNTQNSAAGGSLLGGSTAAACSVNTGSVGTMYYYCVVTNTNNSQSISMVSPTVTVTVSDAVISSVSVQTMPSKTQYKVGESLDTAGLSMLVTYANGSTKIITDTNLFGVYPTKLSTAGSQAITLSYKEKKCTFPVYVEEDATVISSIEMVELPSKTTYEQGETLDSRGLKLRVFSNKGYEDVTTGYTCSPKGPFNTSGTQTITVTYQSKTCTFNISVNEKEETVQSVSVKTQPTTLSYKVGDKLDTTGLVLSVTTSKGSSDVTTGYVYEPLVLNTVGTQIITVKYHDKTCSFRVNVEQAEASPAPTVTATPTPSAEVTAPLASAQPSTDKTSHGSGVLIIVIIIAVVVGLSALGAYLYVTIKNKKGGGSGKR